MKRHMRMHIKYIFMRNNTTILLDAVVMIYQIFGIQFKVEIVSGKIMNSYKGKHIYLLGRYCKWNYFSME